MKISPVFWTAFWAGMSAPVQLYAAPGAYSHRVNVPSLAQSFATVGSRLTMAIGKLDNERRAEGQPTFPTS